MVEAGAATGLGLSGEGKERRRDPGSGWLSTYWSRAGCGCAEGAEQPGAL